MRHSKDTPASAAVRAGHRTFALTIIVTGTATRADNEMSWIADGGHAQAKQSGLRMPSTTGYWLEPSMHPPTELHRLGAKTLPSVETRAAYLLNLRP